MELSSKQISLMGMLIALNVAIGGAVHILKFPIFLDAIGTILGAVVLGLLPAIIIGVLSFVIAAALLNPVYIWFIGTQAIIAITVYFLAAKLGWFRSLPRSIACGVILGIVAGVVSAPVIVLVFSGVTGSGRDIITAALLTTGQQIYKAVALSGVASEPIDKTVQVLAAVLILRSLPKNILNKYRNPVLEKNGFV